jgi:GT2 family glycosyltransferase
MSSLGVHRYISPVESIKVEWISGAAFLTKKEVIEKTGAFDEIFNPAYYEETDWEKRTLDSGFIIYTVPSSIVYHKGAGSESSYNFNKQDLYYRNRAIFYMRHYKQYLLGRFILDVYKGIKNKMVGRIFASYINGIKAYSGSYGRIRTVRIGN